MAVKNSFVSLANQLEILTNNSLKLLASLNDVVSSTESEIIVSFKDTLGQDQTTSLPSIGSIKSDINILTQNIKTLSSLDQRGSIIRVDENTGKRIISYDINREPNTIPELTSINTFLTERNWLFDSLLNPLLNVEIDLNGKIEDNVRKVLSRRYIIKFIVDEYGNPTEIGNTAINLFNNIFKNRTNIEIDEIESWISNTPGIAPDKTGDKINYDEQFFDLEANKLKYEGFFTILGVEEDTVNRKRYYQIDTLDYYELETGTVKQLQINDDLIINTEISTTRYRIVEVNKQSSETKLRLELIEGFEPLPVGILRGMKFYSPIIKNKKVEISVGFNEWNVVFLKAFNTENYILGRNFSKGVAFYTNDLNLSSSKNLGENGKNMQQFYIETVKDFGELLKDYVDRFIPRNKGVLPNSPLLTDINFRVVQSNKFLTDTPSLEDQRRKNQQILDLRSKIDETNKVIQEKRKELFGKVFKNSKDKIDVENQIKKLTEQSSSDTTLLSSTVSELLAISQNNNTVDAEYEIQGFWQMPSPVESGKTRSQEVIQFYVEYKYSNIDGKESENNTFKVTEENGNLINAVFSPWNSHLSPLRRREFDINTQSLVWSTQKLDSIDEPNINSVRLPISPNERITIRVKSISEVGYPESIIESLWSNELTVTFPTELLQPRNPQIIFQKNADLEDLRNRVQGDLDRKGLSQHLGDSVTFENKFFVHNTDNIGTYDPNGKIITLSDKLKQLESADPVEKSKDIVLTQPWNIFGNGFGTPKYYKHEGRVYLSGVIKVDKGTAFKNIDERFPVVDVSISGSLNPIYSKIGTLPEGYRPESKVINSALCKATTVAQDTKTARVDIDSEGNIILYQGNSGWVSLDGINFRII